MPTFPDAMQVYKQQLKQGEIQAAYRGLMEFMMELRTAFEKKYPDCFVSGSLYAGYMDMTYFSIVPEPLRQRKLKIAIVFLHEAFRFEVWLAGTNKQIQSKYWKLFKESGWKQSSLVPTIVGADSILEHKIVDEPDFGDLAGLSAMIERETLKFMQEVESFLKSAQILTF